MVAGAGGLAHNLPARDTLFRRAHMLLAIHAEDDPTIKLELEKRIARFGLDIPIEEHPLIRSAEACYTSSSEAVERAKAFGTRLHVLHISTARELELFEPGPLDAKRITAEACVHHLWFTDADYAAKSSLIKWNPAVKTKADRDAIRSALLDGRIDVVATDHAPHLLPWKPETDPKEYLAALKIRTSTLRNKAQKFDFKTCKVDDKKDLLPWPII